MIKYIGDDWKVKIALKDSSGNPVDITGYSLKFYLKNEKGSQDPEITQAFTITDAVNGKAEAIIPRTETAEICEGLRIASITSEDNDSLLQTIYQLKWDILENGR